MIYGFSRMKVVSMAHNDTPESGVTSLRSRSRRLCSGRGRVDAGRGARGSRAGARRARLRDDRRLRVDVRRLPPRPDGARRRRNRAGDDDGHRSFRAGPRVDRLRQLPRHVDRAQRRRRIALRPAGVRRARGAARRLVGQVDGRPSAGCERCGRSRDRRAGHVARLPAAHDQPARSRSGVRPRFHPEHRTRGGVEAALCNCLGFGSKNSALVLGAPREHRCSTC